ncbi:MAG: sigma-70 family RNA polymerase sigma factor, partial [Clostridia bacterium]|nr:sigma-70 family RNA polymerase sigma factor [Clostridia bacterium]
MNNDRTNEDIKIEEHLKLVHSCCQRFRGRGIEYDDIFQSGCIGLTKAKNNFDFSKGVQFSTYAVPVILGEIKALFRSNNNVKISRKIKDIALKIKIESDNFSKFYGREPNISELSDILKIDKFQIIEALECEKTIVSLDSPCEEDENFQRLEIPVPFDDEKISTAISINQALKNFVVKDKKLIYLRFFRG